MFDIKEELKKLPDRPGVYLMKNSDDVIIYVGKAKILKNRVRQYFQNSANHSPKVKSMVSNIASFEYIVTDTEVEALILENNLIKKYEPKYNIMLRDDKTYPYIKITVNEKYPRIFMTRQLKKDKAKYFGPYTSSGAIKENLEIIHKLFPLRRCLKKFPRDFNKERPCLNYHIGQCKAPCNKMISEEDYQKYVDSAIEFLNGKHDKILKQLENEMFTASDNLEFERAAEIRDKISAVKRLDEKQVIENMGLEDRDVIGFVRAGHEAMAQIFFIRGGKMTGREHFLLNDVDEEQRSEILAEFIKRFYSGTPFIPKEIIVQEEFDDKEIIEGWLSEIKGQKVILTVPQKGEKHRLAEMAGKNAMILLEQFGEQIKREQRKTIGALEEIRQALGVSQKLNRIESYDISNTQGFESVASMVVFEDGKPKRSDYRKFKIKTVFGANDYASMSEVISRRFLRYIKEKNELGENEQEKGKFNKLPDVLFLDGGKGQISAVKKVLDELKINVLVCGMVKDDYHRTRGLIFDGEEITLPYSSEGFKLITRIQDEVHRFAIDYHRRLRAKKQLHSVLEDIEGVGEIRRKALMKHFGSIEKIKDAEVSELAEVEGMNIKSAESVYNFFRR